MLSISGRRIPKVNALASPASSSSSKSRVSNILITNDSSSSISPQQLLLSTIFLSHEFPQCEKLQQQKLFELYDKDKKEFFASALPKNWLMFSTLVVDRLFPSSAASSSSTVKFDFTKQLFLSKFTNPDTFHELFQISKRISNERMEHHFLQQQQSQQQQITSGTNNNNNVFLLEELDGKQIDEDQSGKQQQQQPEVTFAQFLSTLVPVIKPTTTTITTGEKEEDAEISCEKNETESLEAVEDDDDHVDTRTPIEEFLRIAPPKFWKARILYEMNQHQQHQQKKNSNNSTFSKNQNTDHHDNDPPLPPSALDIFEERILEGQQQRNHKSNNVNDIQQPHQQDQKHRAVTVSSLQKIFLEGILSHPFWEGHGQENFEKVHAATVECLSATTKFYAFQHLNSNNNNNTNINNKKKYVQIPIGESPVTTSFVRKARHLYENAARPDLFISLLEYSAILCFRDIDSTSSSSLIIQNSSDIRNITLVSSRMLNLHPDLTPYFITSASKRSSSPIANQNQNSSNSEKVDRTSTFLSASTQEKFTWAKRGLVLALSLMSPRRLMEEKQQQQQQQQQSPSSPSKNAFVITREWDLCLKCISNAAVFTGRDDDEATKKWLNETKEQLLSSSNIINYYPDFSTITTAEETTTTTTNSYSCFSVRLVDILDTLLSVWKTAHNSSSSASVHPKQSTTTQLDASTRLHLSSIANVARSSVSSILKHFEDSLETRLKVVGFHPNVVQASVPLALDLLSMKSSLSSTSTKENQNYVLPSSGVEIILHNANNNTHSATCPVFLKKFLLRSLDAALASPQPLPSTYNVLDAFANYLIHHVKSGNEEGSSSSRALKSSVILMLIGNEQVFEKLDSAFLRNYGEDNNNNYNNNRNISKKKKTPGFVKRHHPVTTLLIQKFGLITPLPPDDFSEVDFLTNYLFSVQEQQQQQQDTTSTTSDEQQTSPSSTVAAVKLLLNQLQTTLMNSSDSHTLQKTVALRQQVNEFAKKIFASLMLRTYDEIFSGKLMKNDEKLTWTCCGCNGKVYWPARFCLNCTLLDSSSSSSSSSFTCPNCKHSSNLFSSPSSHQLNTARCTNCLTLHPASECFVEYQKSIAITTTANGNNNIKKPNIFSLFPHQAAWECNSCSSSSAGVGQICVPVIVKQSSATTESTSSSSSTSTSNSTCGCPQCKTENPNRLVSCTSCGSLNRSEEDVICKNGCGEVRKESEKLKTWLKESENMSNKNLLPPLLLWNCPCCATLKVITSSTSQKETMCGSCGYRGNLFSTSDSTTTNKAIVLPYQQWRCGCGTLNSPTHYHCITCSSNNNNQFTCTSCHNLVSSSAKIGEMKNKSSSSSSTVPILVGTSTFQQQQRNCCPSCSASHPIDSMKMRKPVWTLCADCDTILPTSNHHDRDDGAGSNLRCPSCSQKREARIKMQQQVNDSSSSSSSRLRVSFSACPWSCHKCGEVNDIFSVIADQQKNDDDKICTTNNNSKNPAVAAVAAIQIGPSGALLCNGCGADRLPVSLFAETERWNCNHCGTSNNNSGFVCSNCHELHPHVGKSAVYSWVCGEEEEGNSACNTINPSWLKKCSKCGSEKRKSISSPSPAPNKIDEREEIQLRYLPWHLSSSSSSKQQQQQPTSPPLCTLCLEHHASLKCSREHESKRLNALEEQLLSLGSDHHEQMSNESNNSEVIPEFMLLPTTTAATTTKGGKLPFPMLDGGKTRDDEKASLLLESSLSGGLY